MFQIKNFTLIILIIFSQQLMAETKDISQLEQQLLQATGNERIPLLAKLTEYYFDETPEKAKKYGEEALLILKSFPDNGHRLSIGHNLFDAYRNLSELEKAFKLVNENHKLAEDIGNLEQKAEANIDFSNILSDKNSDYKRAIKYLNIACEQLKELNDMTAFGSCLNNTGLAYYYDTNYEKALNYYFKTLEIENYSSQIQATHTYGNIALINMQYGRWAQALIHYHQALTHAKKFNKKSYISEQLINIGVAYLFNDELDKSIEYFDAATVLEKEIGNIGSLFIIAKRLGEVYVEKKQFNIALNYYQEATQLSESMSSDGSYIEITMAIGVLNAKLERFQEALTYFNNALERAIKTARKPYIYEAHENLYITNKDVGNFEQSLHHHEIYFKLKSEKSELNRLDKITELEEKYNAEQRESKIEMLTKDNQLEALKSLQQQYYAVAILTIIILFSGFVFYRQKQKSLLVSERAEMMEELMMKKNQLLADVSHELGTPLTVLKLQVESLKDDLEEDVQVTYDALDNKLDDIQHLIDDIHQLAQSDVGVLQLNLEPFELNQTLDSWEQELRQFVNTNKLSFEVSNKLPDNLMVNFDRDRIKQVFTNLLTNSIKYTNKPGKVRLSATAKNNTLYLAIEDSSPGVPEQELISIFERLYRVEGSRSRETGGSGLGLAICKSLIEGHRGQMSAKHSDLGGLKIIIELPINDI